MAGPPRRIWQSRQKLIRAKRELQHHWHLTAVQPREPDVVMLGDSLVHHLRRNPVWQELYKPLNCLNFGIPGDCVQNMLWRILHGELRYLNPKVFVLLIGTNNQKNSPEEVSDGIKEIVCAIRRRKPLPYIVVIELLPREQFPNRIREQNRKVNFLLRKKLEGVDRVRVVNTAGGLVRSNGSISRQDVPDFLLLSDRGYRKAFQPLYELLTELLFN